MEIWQTLTKKLILDLGRFLKVETHKILLPDGQIIDEWSWVITPDFINVVLVDSEGQFICFEQTKYAVGQTLAIVGGYIEPGEDPLEAAKREVLEETGYLAEHWQPLGVYAVDANRGAGNAYAFLATDATKIAAPKSDDLEEQHLVEYSSEQMKLALSKNAFKVLPWSNAVALALCTLSQENNK